MIGEGKALLYTLVLGVIIFFCRALPFVMLKNSGVNDDKKNKGKILSAFLKFVEAVAPPVAMTVLAVNALASPIRDHGITMPHIAASLVCAIVHLWKRNALFSIIGGTAVFMLLERLSA